MKRRSFFIVLMAVIISYSTGYAIDKGMSVSFPPENQSEKGAPGKEVEPPYDEKVSESEVTQKTLSEEKKETLNLDERVRELEDEIRRMKEETAARKALEPTEDERIREEEIREILETSGRQYTLLGKGEMELDYSFNYSYSASEGISIEGIGTPLPEFFINISYVKQHTFTHSLALNYGILDNLSLSLGVPYTYKYNYEKSQLDIVEDDREREAKGKDGSGLGDVSFSLQWQPVKAGGGQSSIVCFLTFKSKTGKSPYDIDTDFDLSTGSGHNSIGAGVSISKPMDPLVPFGTISYSKSFYEAGLSYKVGEVTLKKVEPGDTIALSMGVGYALSYNVSLNIQYQQSYTFEPDFVYSYGGRLYRTSEEAQNSAVVSIGTGWRLSASTSLYVDVGFGLTPDTQDFFLGARWPLEI
ncbi:MAG: hypothetical protein SWO11_04850 [Thermodesulfobacteriota bacterium]|nr:hypothetical protein [Thermodesulfobacteriota bacterium]